MKTTQRSGIPAGEKSEIRMFLHCNEYRTQIEAIPGDFPDGFRELALPLLLSPLVQDTSIDDTSRVDSSRFESIRPEIEIVLTNLQAANLLASPFLDWDGPPPKGERDASHDPPLALSQTEASGPVE